MANRTVADLVKSRHYKKLKEAAEFYVNEGQWDLFVEEMVSCGYTGKVRDALVTLLQLESVGGTDSDPATEFSSLQGHSMDEIRAAASDHALEILRKQIPNRHTHFLDAEAMATTPFALLVSDVIEARAREIESLPANPSRTDFLKTYYGYTILTKEGALESTFETKPEVISALNEISSGMGRGTRLNPKYETMGTKTFFGEEFAPRTAIILSENVKLSLYKSPHYRAKAAQKLGLTCDSRADEFLRHRLEREENFKVRVAIIEALGDIGLHTSLNTVTAYIPSATDTPGKRTSTEELMAAIKSLGGFDVPRSRRVLVYILRTSSKSVKIVEAAMQSLVHLNPADLPNLLAPFLRHKSRPVVRSSLSILLDKGERGKRVILGNLPRILSSIGSDPASSKELCRLLALPEVSSREDVHDYYGSRISRRVRNFSFIVQLARDYLQKPYSEKLSSALNSFRRQG